MSADWTFQAQARDGTPFAHLEPSQFVYRRRLNAPATAQARLVDPPGTLQPGQLFRGYRAATLGATRTLGCSLVIVNVRYMLEDTRRVAVLELHDAAGELAERSVSAEVYMNGTTDGVEDGANDLVDQQNTREPFGLAVSSTGWPADVLERTVPEYQTVLDALTTLLDHDAGTYWRCDPYTGTLAGLELFSELVPVTPALGNGLVESGAGTSGTALIVDLERRPPVNFVTALGGGDSDATLVSTASDASSITSYGLHERLVRFSDVVIQATLDAHALEELRPEPIEVLTVAPSQLEAGVQFANVDVGELLQVNVPDLALAGEYLLTEHEITLGPDGTERTTDLVLESYQA